MSGTAHLISLVLVFVVAVSVAARAEPPLDPEERTARLFETLRDQPERLEIFLRAMPKGGDLHNHLLGAVYAERMIEWAASDGFCIKLSDFSLVRPPCNPSNQPPATAALRDPVLYGHVIDAFSMRHFVPGRESAEDHFFATFAKFIPLEDKRAGDMVAELALQAARENTTYIETMWSPGMIEASALAAALDPTEDFDRLAKTLQPKVAALVPKVMKWVDSAEQRRRMLLNCDAPQPQKACAVTIRYLAEALRTYPEPQVFAQALLSHLLVEQDARFVGLNFVAPEDNPVALRDYGAHMRMLAYLQAQHPTVKLTLHAGEVAPGLVPPADLTSHIRDAVEIAHARRIGHGVDIASEAGAAQLLAEMATRHVLVEINLTSNDVILGVSGAAHPFEIYRRAGVPLALSTDDPGVSRIDLTHEYVRAAETYHLGYRDLKQMALNSLEYAFLEGASLHAADDACAKVDRQKPPPPGPCRDLIDRSDKARLQWQTEGTFAAFETTIAATNP